MPQDRRPRRPTTTVERLPGDRGLEALAPEEERLVRMRQGTPLAPEAPLPGKAPEGSEAAAALHRIEAMLFQQMRQRRLETAAPKPTDSPVKAKIVRALRKKS